MKLDAGIICAAASSVWIVGAAEFVRALLRPSLPDQLDPCCSRCRPARPASELKLPEMRADGASGRFCIAALENWSSAHSSFEMRIVVCGSMSIRMVCGVMASGSASASGWLRADSTVVHCEMRHRSHQRTRRTGSECSHLCVSVRAKRPAIDVVSGGGDQRSFRDFSSSRRLVLRCAALLLRHSPIAPSSEHRAHSALASRGSVIDFTRAVI